MNELKEMELYSVNEVLVKLRVSRRTLYKLINTGKITPVKIGRSTRFTNFEIMRFLVENQGIGKDK